MATSNPQIIGAGMQSGAPFVLGHLVFVSQASPPVISSYAPLVTNDGVVHGITSVPTSAGVYNAVVGATEMLRVQGGIIVSGTGTDSVQIGRAAVANTVENVVIGSQATAAGQSGIVIGARAFFSVALGVVVGTAAGLTGNGAGSNGVIVGDHAAGTVLASGGVVVVGTQAVGHDSDVVIGYQATSTLSNAFGAHNIVIGQQATANIAQGYSVAIGSNAQANIKNAVAIGGLSTVAAQGATVLGQGSTISALGGASIVVGQGNALTATDNIILASGLASAVANVCWIGGPGLDIQLVRIGQGATVASPALRTIHFTNALGVDNAAGDIRIEAPRSSGNATPSSLVFRVGVQVAGSSATLQTQADVLTLSNTLAAGHVATFANAIVVPGPTTLNAVAYTWPATAGTNTYVLSTDGIGTLSWVAGGGAVTFPLTGAAMADPAAPAADHASLYYGSLAGAGSPAALRLEDAQNHPYWFQPAAVQGRRITGAVFAQEASAGVLTRQGNGFVSGVETAGGGTLAPIPPTVTWPYRSRINLSGNGATAPARVTADSGAFIGNSPDKGGFLIRHVLGVSGTLTAVTTFLVGVIPTSGWPGTAITDVGLYQGVYFYRSTTANAGNWSVSSDNGAARTANVDTGIPCTAGHVYELVLYMPPDSTTVVWKITDVTVGASATGTFTGTVTVNTMLQAIAAVSSTQTALVSWLGAQLEYDAATA